VNDLAAFLSTGGIFELSVRLVLGAIASFVAIASWSKTRHAYWFFVIAGILCSYAGTLYRSLRAFGLFSGREILIFDAPLGVLLSDNLSILCFIVAGVFYIRANR